MSEEIKVGDKVRLKSGGPNMMVDHVGPEYDGGPDRAWCEWFDEKRHPQKKDFALTSVEKVDAGPSSSELAARGPKAV